MRFITYLSGGEQGLAVKREGVLYGQLRTYDEYPGDLRELVNAGGDALDRASEALLRGKPLELDDIVFLPPIPNPPKIICIGLNYLDHSAESGSAPPTYPAIFARYTSSLIAHRDPLILPSKSSQFDYEGELAAIVGRGGRGISRATALDHVVGYSIFNDASVRDFQVKSTQWTIGKNFDGTGAFGPEFVTADELPPGAKGLMLETRLNGKTVQRASTSDMIFDVAGLVELLSDAMTLEPGDVIVTGTPAGVGFARKPPLYMKDGDTCEVEVQQIGVLRNPVKTERID